MDMDIHCGWIIMWLLQNLVHKSLSTCKLLNILRFELFDSYKKLYWAPPVLNAAKAFKSVLDYVNYTLVNKNNNKIPWITESFILILKNRLNPIKAHQKWSWL